MELLRKALVAVAVAVLSFNIYANDPPLPTAIQILVDFYIENNISHVIMIGTGSNGQQILYVITTNQASEVTSASTYTTFGDVIGGASGIYGSTEPPLLGDFIEQYQLSHSEDCMANPYCLDDASNSHGSF